MEELAKEIHLNFSEIRKDQLSKKRKTYSNKQELDFDNPLKNYDLLTDFSTETNDSFEYDLERLADRKFKINRNCTQEVEEFVPCMIPKPSKGFKTSLKYPEIESFIPKIFHEESF